MTVEKKNKPHANVVDYFKELSFYNKHIEKPKIKCLKNINLLSGLPFLRRSACNKIKLCV